jgi:hypothetical protein
MYEFDQEIIEALREGKTVWARMNHGEWFELSINEQTAYSVRATFIYQWSLTKPKVKVKKTYERWVNIFRDGTSYSYSCKHTAEEESKFYKYIEAVAVHVVTAYEVEQE